ncbi:MAG: cell wall hydrolase [Clostridia bacterium]|nr:cell wall hydrolase [Clostridia bacterium]
MRKKIKKILGAAAIMIALSGGRVCADIPADVRINGEFLMQHDAFIESGRTYVPLRLAAEKLGFDVDYSESGITVGGIGADGCRILNGTAYIPARTLGEMTGCEVSWDSSLFTVDISNTEFEADDSLYWLSRIISAESEGEIFDGKVAVGNVVLNRVASPEYPSTVREVVFDNKNGVQFTPSVNGRIYNTPTDASVTAAKYAMRGSTPAGGSLFFLNEKIASNKWIVNNRTFFTTIGNHNFYL